ncbi:MAG TPA: dolichyl-phosphate beta-glucosyltransferase [Candidatus Acidoferrales bacterium]|nr:dolichyl-phosphate beta-glucosyltransferase [Candidatus Acidoferrales bacterium]
MSDRPELSIIIPAYNEEKRLPRTLTRIQDYLSSKNIALDTVEIIIVDDGSKDATIAVAQEWSRRLPVRVVSNGRNHGKGFSVRHGMLEARGRIALFTDADLSSPIQECTKLLVALASGNDVAIGSRAVDRSLIEQHQSPYREIAGMIFNAFVRLFTLLPFHDTQCGFKAFLLDRSRAVFEQQRIEGFGFDPEILFIAKRHGLRMSEVPVRWAHDPATKVHVIRDSFVMFCDLLYIRWNWLLGRYPLHARCDEKRIPQQS